ncbi:MAG: peptidylprolyl isomerase [Solirubrobacteraceae bacterium]
MRSVNVLVLISLAVLVLTACGKDSSPGSDDAASTTTPVAGGATATTAIAPRSARDGCRAVAPPTPSEDPTGSRSAKKLSSKRRHVAVLRTNCGTISIALDVKRSPKTTSSFAGLVRDGFYDGLSFHRVAKPGGNDYVIQGGDPLGTGNGGPGYSVVEAPAKKTRYVRGVVAMAKTAEEARGTSGSQFFIVTADEAPLPPDYALLGRVSGDTSAVRRIARLATDAVSEMPVDPVVIESARIR